MRVAALYDIHGNLPALHAVLDAVRRAGVDRIVVGGDVLPGPMPAQCLERLHALELPIECIHGNGERAVLEELAGGPAAGVPESLRPMLQWCGAQLSEAQRAAIAAWPATLERTVPGLGRVLFCHATPRNDTDIFTRHTPDAVLAPLFHGVDADTVVCGHTHMQFDRRVDRVRIVNAGSVGMPFGLPGACYALLGPTIELCRVDYDLARAARHIAATEFPDAAAYADRYVVHPPTEAQMLKAYERGTLS